MAIMMVNIVMVIHYELGQGGKAIGIDNSGFKNVLLILTSDETCDEVIPKGQETTKTKVCCLSRGYFSSPLANSQIMT